MPIPHARFCGRQILAQQILRFRAFLEYKVRTTQELTNKTLERVTIEKEGVAAEFKWERTRLFDKATCENIYSLVMKNPQARVLVASNPR